MVYLGVRVCNVIVERGRRLLRVCCICVFSLVCVADPWTAEEDAGYFLWVLVSVGATGGGVDLKLLLEEACGRCDVGGRLWPNLD